MIRIGLFLIGGLVLLLAVTYLVIPTAVELLADRLATDFPPPGKMVLVGDHKLHLFCTGQGSPTVVVENGLGVDWVGWAAVADQVSPKTRICFYDRAGYGWSQAGPMPRTAAVSADELYELLKNSQEMPPYVLVGHSFGAHIARVFANRHPDLLSAVLLVDPSSEDVPEPPRTTSLRPRFGTERLRRLKAGPAGLSPAVQALPEPYQWRALVAASSEQHQAENSELDTMVTSQAEVRESPFPPGIPLVVISATRPYPGEPESEQIRMTELQRQIATATPLGRQIMTDSGHMVAEEQPEVIVNAIDQFLGELEPGH